MKKETLKWQPKQYYERKMSKSDLDSHINEMKRELESIKTKKLIQEKKNIKEIKISIDSNRKIMYYINIKERIFVMGKLSKWQSGEDLTGDLRVVQFVSRNKDNTEVKGFKVRRTSFVSTRSDEELIEMFKVWTRQGKQDEFSRLYVSLNKRNHKSVKHSLIHYLLDQTDLNMGAIDSHIAMIAAQPEHAITKKYFYDFDSDEVEEFVKDLKEAFSKHLKRCGLEEKELKVEVLKSPNYYTVVLEDRFDTREIDEKWKGIAEIKKDCLYCLYWVRKNKG